ncbi:hypothetical protein DSO57_1002586 [Entomophthora muscae]|uniref:Uncharacterized protein n=1 Tax=Entomophthora muscae TaxID=34485 RepID=A0ACC2U735_9FUNG|nr:hypothetical protein DSO57_1002586 [Entomophthora muscae]
MQAKLAPEAGSKPHQLVASKAGAQEACHPQEEPSLEDADWSREPIYRPRNWLLAAAKLNLSQAAVGVLQYKLPGWEAQGPMELQGRSADLLSQAVKV